MKKIFSILLASLALSSCVDTVILPDNKVLDEDYWKKKSEVEAVVGAAYAQMTNSELLRNMIIWGDFRSDELVISSSVLTSDPYKTPLDEIYSMNIQTDNLFTSWGTLYSVINYCNLVLEKAEGVIAEDPDYTRSDYETTRSQMLALRAWSYFYLVRVFHDVPVTNGAYLESDAEFEIPQKSPAEVLQMCINDLTEAVQYAPANNAYSGTKDTWRNRGYFNRDGINALLADIYLWRASVNHDQNDYQQCVNCCDQVIASKKSSHILQFNETESDYYLSTYDKMYNTVFGKGNSEESIMEIEMNFVNSELKKLYNNISGSKQGYLKTTATYAVSNGSSTATNVFKNAYDQRLFESIYDVSATKEEYDVRKYTDTESAGKLTSKSREQMGSIFMDWILYRLSDVMLMKAEALVQLNQPEEAFALCKAVNDRAITDVPNYGLKYSTYASRMEELVLAERARELCFEGKRWFDLMRYNYRHMEGVDYNKLLADQENQPKNSDEFFNIALSKYSTPAAMKAKMPTEPYLYMPINEDEVKINKSLKQNPVYKSKTE